MSVEKWTKIAPIFFKQTAAEYSKVHVNFSIVCQDVLIGKLNMIALSKQYHRVLVFEKIAKVDVLM